MEGLKNIIIESGLSDSELAKKTGLTRSSILKYRRGERKPSLEVAIKLADYFEIKDLRIFL